MYSLQQIQSENAVIMTDRDRAVFAPTNTLYAMMITTKHTAMTICVQREREREPKPVTISVSMSRSLRLFYVHYFTSPEHRLRPFVQQRQHDLC